MLGCVAPVAGSIAPTNLVYIPSSSSMRACLPRTGLFTTAAPVRSATNRVVPTATVLLITVNSGLNNSMYRAHSPTKSLI